MNNEFTTVYLSAEEAKLFMEFQRRYRFMQMLESLGVFDLKSAKVTLHFDNLGEVASIDKQQYYRL